MVKHGWVLGGSTRFLGWGFLYRCASQGLAYLVGKSSKGVKGKRTEMGRKSAPHCLLIVWWLLPSSLHPTSPHRRAGTTRQSSLHPKTMEQSRGLCTYPHPCSSPEPPHSPQSIPSPAGTTHSPAGSQKVQDRTPSRARVQHSANNAYSW